MTCRKTLFLLDELVSSWYVRKGAPVSLLRGLIHDHPHRWILQQQQASMAVAAQSGANKKQREVYVGNLTLGTSQTAVD